MLLIVPDRTAAPVLPVTFTPRPVPRSRPEIVNPMRGLYTWRGQNIVPIPDVLPRPAYDMYERYTWRELEPRQNQYDFTAIEQDATRAARTGRKLALRVRALVAEEGMNVPDYLVDQMPLGWWHDYNDNGERDTYVPDWNDPDFIDGARRLVRELGRQYNGDPRIAWVDIGMYGNWGEWHMDAFRYPHDNGAEDMTLANKRQLVDMHVAAFEDTRLVAMTSDTPGLLYALEQSPHIGWRRDSLGHPHFDQIRRRDPATWNMIQERWRTAPVITEFIAPYRQADPETYERAVKQVRQFHVSLVSNGNTVDWEDLSRAGQEAFLLAGKTAGYRYVLNEVRLPLVMTAGQALQITSSWSNDGVAPAYEPWNVVFQLRTQDTNMIVWEGTSSLDLQTVLPTTRYGSDRPVVLTDQLSLPASLPIGDYALTLIVRDPAAYRQPLALAIAGRTGQGYYRLGNVKVQRNIVGHHRDAAVGTR